VKHALLALIAGGAAHGYDLKLAFEEQFGSVWPPVNIGQIYSTLQRLERDGLVRCHEVEQSGRPAKKVYSLTEDGQAALREWVNTPSEGPRVRDDFVMKLVLAHTARLDDPYALIDRQRTAYLHTLRDLGRVQPARDAEGLATELLVAGATLHLEADLRWLNLCEERFRQEDVR
jgi:DNA-binding PadR family transcriptional regulator